MIIIMIIIIMIVNNSIDNDNSLTLFSHGATRSTYLRIHRMI